MCTFLRKINKRSYELLAAGISTEITNQFFLIKFVILRGKLRAVKRVLKKKVIHHHCGKFTLDTTVVSHIWQPLVTE